MSDMASKRRKKVK